MKRRLTVVHKVKFVSVRRREENRELNMAVCCITITIPRPRLVAIIFQRSHVPVRIRCQCHRSFKCCVSFNSLKISMTTDEEYTFDDIFDIRAWWVFQMAEIKYVRHGTYRTSCCGIGTPAKFNKSRHGKVPSLWTRIWTEIPSRSYGWFLNIQFKTTRRYARYGTSKSRAKRWVNAKISNWITYHRGFLPCCRRDHRTGFRISARATDNNNLGLLLR